MTRFWFRRDREQLARIERLLEQLVEIKIAELTVCASGDRGVQLERCISAIRRRASIARESRQ